MNIMNIKNENLYIKEQINNYKLLTSIINTEDKNIVIENYKLSTTNVNRPIAKIFKIPEFTYDENFIWYPPKEHGLKNCDYIIEPCYHKNIKKGFDIDYYEIIKDDIRNLKILNKFQLEYIKKLDHKYKNELLFIYKDCIEALIEIL
jgi:hypothetical protein